MQYSFHIQVIFARSELSSITHIHVLYEREREREKKKEFLKTFIV